MDLTYSQPFTSVIYKHTGKKSGYISKKWYEEGCQNLLDEILKTKVELGKDKPLVVVKEMNDRMPLDLFQRWIGVPSFVLISLRDPHLQLMSMIRQNAISLFNLPSRPSIEEVFQEYLERFENIPMRDPLERTFLGFYIDKWLSLEKEVQILEKTGKNFLFFDTTVLRHRPHESLETIFKGINLDVLDVSICISGFKERKIRFIDTMNRDRSATQEAYASDSFRPLDMNEMVPSERFIGRHMGALGKTVPIYKKFIASPRLSYVPTREVIFSQSWKAEKGVTLDKAQPFTAQTFIERK